MNRLWVRLSLAISGLIMVFVLLPFLAFLVVGLVTRDAHPLDDGQRPDRVSSVRRFYDPWRDIPENFVLSVLLTGAVGVLGGIAASRILAAPISTLADTAQSIGRGDLSARVKLKSSSREIDALANSFNKMASDLQHASELRNNLMADVSHELRTPLTVLEGNLRAALDHVYELDDEQIANLYEQTRHLIRLVNELRELTLAEASQLPLGREATSLAQLVQETVAVFEPLAEEKQIRLSAELAPGLPTITADRSRIRQVLHNLISNALQHTPNGGAVVIKGQVHERQVRLTVQDSGEGIDAQQIPHVFDRFYRTDPSRSRETGGSGLGLAIVKAIVEAHGGAVSASSPGVGQGSSFTFALPIA